MVTFKKSVFTPFGVKTFTFGFVETDSDLEFAVNSYNYNKLEINSVTIDDSTFEFKTIVKNYPNKNILFGPHGRAKLVKTTLYNKELRLIVCFTLKVFIKSKGVMDCEIQSMKFNMSETPVQP